MPQKTNESMNIYNIRGKGIPFSYIKYMLIYFIKCPIYRRKAGFVF